MRELLRNYGFAFVAWRSAWEIALRTRYFERRLPQHSLAASTVQIDRAPFFLPVDLGTLAGNVGNPERAIAQADDIRAGRFTWFGRHQYEVGSPPPWFRSPVGDEDWPHDRHWTRIPELSRSRGDIKWIWELSRFGHTFALARAYALTQATNYAETFWTHVEDWIACNPPETGPHWRCAQEMSLRVLAWIFGLYAFQADPSSSPQRQRRLTEMIWTHAEHIEKVHWYAAHCQRNNHAISEAVGLLTVGLTLPFHPRSTIWKARGLKYLERAILQQVYPDGAYIQHSMNYTRMVVQLLAWTIALTKAAAVTLPEKLQARSRALLQFLLAMQDRTTGHLPNYGPNDGTLILPLADCDYRDFRPALHALGRLLGIDCGFGAGPWEEEAAWLGAAGPDVCPAATQARAFPIGGYYRLAGEGTFGMIRCGTYRDRPHQADMLHGDIWYGAHNVMVDAGTYSYNAPPPWDRHFTATGTHNTISVDGVDQMRRGRRFLWHRWTRAKVLADRATAYGHLFKGEHYGYPGITHRRSIYLSGALYLIVDDLRPVGAQAGSHTFRLHWLLNDFAIEPNATGARINLPNEEQPVLRLIVLADPVAEGTWMRANEEIPRGWQSVYYGERAPAWSFEVTATGARARFRTLIGPAEQVTDLVSQAGAWEELFTAHAEDS